MKKLLARGGAGQGHAQGAGTGNLNPDRRRRAVEALRHGSGYRSDERVLAEALRRLTENDSPWGFADPVAIVRFLPGSRSGLWTAAPRIHVEAHQELSA